MSFWLYVLSFHCCIFGTRDVIEMWTHCNVLTRNSSLALWFLAPRLSWTSLPFSQNRRGHILKSWCQVLHFLRVAPVRLSPFASKQKQSSQVSVCHQAQRLMLDLISFSKSPWRFTWLSWHLFYLRSQIIQKSLDNLFLWNKKIIKGVTLPILL